jgi:signal transduction histidine kinase
MNADLKDARILIVDDQRANIEVLQELLRIQGYVNIFATTDPRQVFNIIDEQKPNLVLLDLSMPFITGFEVMEKLREKGQLNSYMPVLVLTADATTATKQKALSEGASDFLSKPFDLIEAALRIKNLLLTVYYLESLKDQNVLLEEKVKERTQEYLLAKNKAEESDRLKSAFLATISHELRTPLNHVLGFSSLIMDMSEEEETRQFATLIYESGSRFLTMIEDIFDLALIEQASIQLRLSTFKGTELFMEAKNSLFEILNDSGKDDRIQLIFKPESTLLMSYLTTDRQKVNQVLTNLFKNAVKFTSSGSIEFGFHADQQEKIVFYVKDTGIGIPLDKQEMIFEVFRQVEDSHTRQHDGLGIGLAISKRLAETLNAELRLESELGQGAIFYFIVPVEVNLQSTSESVKVSKEKIPNFGNESILVVEDDSTSSDLIVTILKKTKATIHSAANGKEALEIVENNPDISLVLMDLKMPVMDGYQATTIIKQLRPELKVIALTAYALNKDKPKAIEAGCDAIVTKPVNKLLLFNKMSEYLMESSTS